MSKKVLMFSSKACGPCAALKPIVIKNQKQYGFELEVHVLEESADIFADYKIRAVPAIIAIDKNKEVGRLSGAMTERAFVEALAKWGIING